MSIESNVARWHSFMRGELAGGLDALLAEDVAFISPIVFTPQKGKTLTKMYLGAAANTFSQGSQQTEVDAVSKKSKFKYIKEILCGDHAVLEFESEIDGKYINGVDIITWNDAGQITEFKVMIRPLQAINIMHEKMKALL